MSEQSFTPGKLVLKRAAFRPTMFVMREDYTSDEAAVAEVIDKRYAPVFAAAPALLEALQALYDDYKQLADSGDAGFWRLEDCDVGKQAMAALLQATGGESGR